MEAIVTQIEALKVGPDEVLVLKVNLDGFSDVDADLFLDGVTVGLADVGLEHRSLVIVAGEDVPLELAVVAREPARQPAVVISEHEHVWGNANKQGVRGCTHIENGEFCPARLSAPAGERPEREISPEVVDP